MVRVEQTSEVTVDPQYDVLECGHREVAGLGRMLLVRVHRRDLQAMGWRELWEVFHARFPGRWAVQAFPPAELMLDQANKYHLWVVDHGDAFDIATAR